MANLWEQNTPERFWLCDPPMAQDCWNAAIKASFHVLELPGAWDDQEPLLELVLGEGRFGPNHWRLGAGLQIYYALKPAIPRAIVRMIRKVLSGADRRGIIQNWPIDARYAAFEVEVLRQAMLISGAKSIRCRSFWPGANRFAFVLTHDIETLRGQAFVREVAALEERLGFRSSFNFVLDRYPLDLELMQDLRGRGFEVGCHGLKHDGKLFSSHRTFCSRSEILNAKMRNYDMVGFRSPLTHRNPAWMQALEIEYDSSFFDTDPFEPVPGGTMSIWPFFLGRFVELPYTLAQDHTLTAVLGETSPKIWMEKVDFIERYHGMALINTHPDYLRQRDCWKVYGQFLHSMKQRSGFWHALPQEVAQWWRGRATAHAEAWKIHGAMAEVQLSDNAFRW